MSDAHEAAPDWSLLPHNPVGFFALGESFDRKDLKRAYNKLLRRFKPEKAPAEFQKIRAAYEALDERLRYGQSTSPVPGPTVTWREEPQEYSLRTPADPENTETPPSEEAKPRRDRIDRTPIPQEKPLAERLATESPRSLYNDLAAKEEKSAFDYYALAVLSDVVERGKPYRFVEWLLSALKKHPDHGALWRLLHEYLRGPLPDGAEEKLLPAIAKLARQDFFYLLTEPLWLSLLRQGEGAAAVDRLARLLAICQRELRDTEISGRLTFSIQIAKAAFLLGDHPWPRETLDYIEANFEQAPPWMEPELDMLSLLREYADVRQEFRAGHPLRRQLDDALRDYFLEDQQVGDRSVVAAQVAMASDLDALQAAFPLEDASLFRPFYTLWCWVSWDVGERNAPEQEPPTGPGVDWSWRVRELLRDLDKRAGNSAAGLRWTLMLCVYRVMQAFLFLGLPILLCAVFITLFTTLLHAPPDRFDGLGLMLGIAFGILSAWKLNGWLREAFWHRQCRLSSARLYDTLWRPEILRFQQRSHLEGDHFRDLFAQNVSDEIGHSGYINSFVQQDYAPAMLSVAQRFLA